VPALAPVFSIFDEDQRGILMVGPDRRDFVVWYRTRATAWRLDQPDLRLLGGWGSPEIGTEVRASAWSPAGGTWCLVGPARQTCEAGFTIGSGWGILYYVEHLPRWLRHVLNVGWVVALLAPTGYLMRRRWEGAVALAVVLVAMGLIPALVSLRPTALSGWIGAAVGLVAGWTLRRAVWRLTRS
jgi:hypothetical protein